MLGNEIRLWWWWWWWWWIDDWWKWWGRRKFLTDATGAIQLP